RYSVVTFDESWLELICCVGGPDGPTPVGCVCALKNCMKVSPSTTCSLAELPSEILSAVITTVPSCSKRTEVLPLPFASRITSPSSSKVSSWPLFVFSTDSVGVASLPPSPVGASEPVSLPRSSAPPVLSGAPQNAPDQIGRLTSPPANSTQ